jgi:PAS domain S-box-containing protein
MNIGEDEENLNASQTEDLRASEIRYRRLFESARDGILILDFETGKITDVNPYMSEWLDCPRDYFLGKELREIGLFKDAAASAAAFRELQENHYIRCEDLPLENKNGEKWKVEFISNVYTENNRQVVQCNVRDITERKIIERHISNLASIVESSNDAVISKKLDGTILSWNKSAENIFGYTAGEINGRDISILFPPELLPEAKETLEKIKRGESILNFGTVRVRKDGSRVPISLSQSPIRNNQGEIVAVAKIARDVSERNETLEDIQKLNESLEQRVLERTHKLEIANKELEAFSYSVSHDLRAPLRAIDGFSRALLEDYGERLDETGQDYLSRVCAATASMAQLIDDLLNLSRLSRSEMRFEELNLSRLANEIAENLREKDPKRQVKFNIKQGVIVNGDERLLRIALINLFENAWKFTSKTELAEIGFGQIRQNGQTECFVRDNGAGFDMAYADKLFGVFQRLHTMREFEGTGIGLVTVQRIVHRHGGVIRAEGRVGKGAAFYFTL